MASNNNTTGGSFTFSGGHLEEVSVKRGFNGTVSLCNQMDDNNNFVRKLIVKKAADKWVEPKIRKEIEMLESLKFARHIVTIVVSFLPENDLPGALLGMEYMTNGTLSELAERFQVATRRNPTKYPEIPQRVLWYWFLCLTRAVVGMAWPPKGPNVQDETIPADTAPIPLIHGDIKLDNIGIDELDPSSPEPLIPRLKLIDFGDARYEDNHFAMANYGKGVGMFENILPIGMVMCALLGRCRDFVSKRSEPMPLRYTDIDGTTKSCDCYGVEYVSKYTTYDYHLRMLVGRCMAEEAWDRPELSEILAMCESAVATGNPIPGQPPTPRYLEETDEMIADFVKTLVIKP
jgi:serine/threonine protein kinase